MGRHPALRSWDDLIEYYTFIGDTIYEPQTCKGLYIASRAACLPLGHRVFRLNAFGVHTEEMPDLIDLLAKRHTLRSERRMRRLRRDTPDWEFPVRRYRCGAVLAAKRMKFGGPYLYRVYMDGAPVVDLYSHNRRSALRCALYILCNTGRRRYRRGAKSSDGGLWGVRTFKTVWKHGRRWLMSPYTHTLWLRPALVERRFHDSTDVREARGVHAYWPGRRYASRGVSWLSLLEAHTTLALVRGYGRTVQGDDGWRAERVIIEAVLAPDERMARELRQSYPEVNVILWKDGYESLNAFNDPLDAIIRNDANQAKAT